MAKHPDIDHGLERLVRIMADATGLPTPLAAEALVVRLRRSHPITPEVAARAAAGEWT